MQGLAVAGSSSSEQSNFLGRQASGQWPWRLWCACRGIVASLAGKQSVRRGRVGGEPGDKEGIQAASREIQWSTKLS